MKEVTFEITEPLKEMIRKSLEAKEHKAVYDQEPQAGIIMVKDEGVYLMPTMVLPEGKTPTSEKLVFYAEGCNPDKDEDWYQTSRALCGGDDFGQLISDKEFLKGIVDGTIQATHITAEVSPETIVFHASIEVSPWCDCEQKDNPDQEVDFWPDGNNRRYEGGYTCKKHHYTCKNCGKIVQIG